MLQFPLDARVTVERSRATGEKGEKNRINDGKASRRIENSREQVSRQPDVHLIIIIPNESCSPFTPRSFLMDFCGKFGSFPFVIRVCRLWETLFSRRLIDILCSIPAANESTGKFVLSAPRITPLLFQSNGTRSVQGNVFNLR